MTMLCALLVSVPGADTLMEHYAPSLGQHRQFTAPFTQLRYMSMFDEPLESGGTITFSYPDAIKLHYTRPFEAVIVYSQGKLSRYRNEKGTLVEQPSMEIITKAITREMIRWLSADFGKDFPYHATVVNNDSLHLKLVPTNPAAAALFSSIELYLAPRAEYIRTVKLVEESGDSIVIHHESPSFAPVEPSVFQVKP